MKRKILSIVCAALLIASCAASFAACGGGSDAKTVTVAASSTPHAEILEQCKAAMKEKGYTLVVKVMEDYVTPNTATEDGEVDANYFQHTPYLNSFNAEQGTHLVSVATVHYEPFGIYAGKTKSLDALADGASIAVPNDTTNEARALLLLADNGLIELNEGAGLTGEAVALDAGVLVSTVLDDVDIGIINGNYALSAGLKVSEALAAESAESEAAKTYGNVLVVKEGNENQEKIKALVEVITSSAISDYIKATYGGAVVPMK